MAFITLDQQKLAHNYQHLDRLLATHHISWAVVSKMLCGSQVFLEALLSLGMKQVCDSRISHLKLIKEIRPDVETIYIKPPALQAIPHVVAYADISCNTEFETICRLSEEAVRQGKVHRIIIMIELGELREGVLRDDLVSFYERVFELPGIEVIGIGANLTCMYGVLPNHDKLIQLSLYKQLIEARFNRKIPFVSGGASVTIPLIFEGTLPAGINHFRIGETLYLGTDVYHQGVLPGMHPDVFRLYAQIIELNEKPTTPMGEMGANLNGEVVSFEQQQGNPHSYRALLDVGLLDVDEAHVWPIAGGVKIVGASSDMIVVDLGENPNEFKVGDFLEFRMDYMGTLRLMNSPYVEKKLAADLEDGHHLQACKIANLNI